MLFVHVLRVALITMATICSSQDYVHVHQLTTRQVNFC